MCVLAAETKAFNSFIIGISQIKAEETDPEAVGIVGDDGSIIDEIKKRVACFQEENCTRCAKTKHCAFCQNGRTSTSGNRENASTFLVIRAISNSIITTNNHIILSLSKFHISNSLSNLSISNFLSWASLQTCIPTPAIGNIQLNKVPCVGVEDSCTWIRQSSVSTLQERSTESAWTAGPGKFIPRNVACLIHLGCSLLSSLQSACSSWSPLSSEYVNARAAPLMSTPNSRADEILGE